MGKLIASTFVGSSWLSYVGYPTEITSTLAEYQMAAHDDFTSFACTDTGLSAVRSNGDFWSSSWYDQNMFGLTLATYLPFSYIAGGYKKVAGWNTAPGVWAVDSTNKLRYSGDHFRGCGVADPGAGKVPTMAQVGSGTFWDKLVSVNGADSQEYGIFNLTDDVMTAGTNEEAVLWDGNSAATRVAPASVESLSGASQMSSDSYLSPVFVTPGGQLYYFWLNTGVVNTRLLDTGVAEIIGGAQNYGIVYRKTDGSLWYRRAHWNTSYANVKFSDGPFVKACADFWNGHIAAVDAAGKVSAFSFDASPQTYSLVTGDLFPSYTVIDVAMARKIVVGLEAPVPPPPVYFWQGNIGAIETP